VDLVPLQATQYDILDTDLRWDMAFEKKTIKDVDIKPGMRVIVRADFNVPLNSVGEIANDFRIQQALPTLKFLLKKGARLIVLSHLGRPDGRPDKKLSLAPVAAVLTSNLAYPVLFVDDTVGERVRSAADDLENGTVLLLENTRFDSREEANDKEFAKELASFGELFVQDGFGVTHRTHASTVGITEHLPSVAGLLLKKEFEQITKTMDKPKRPLLAIIGGAKVSDKIKIINKFVEIADAVAIGGAMANTFLKAEGMEIGSSIYEESALDDAKEILDHARQKQSEKEFTFYLPQDGVVSTSTEGTDGLRIVDWGMNVAPDIMAYPSKPSPDSYTIGENDMILDIGPASANFIAGLTRQSKTIVWNGNLGLTETRPKQGNVGPFEHGSNIVAREIDKKFAPIGQFSLIGGGDTASYILSLDGMDLPDHVSTGGGASLDLMSGKHLPAVDALDNK